MMNTGYFSPTCTNVVRALLLGVLMCCAGTANAQEPRYSWFEIGFLGQDQSLVGTQVPVPGQVVDIATNDGTGVRFRGSLDIWRNFYAFGDYGSVDPDVAGIITNEQGQFTAADEFDLTTIRGGVGYRFEPSYRTHVIGELSFDSLDYDFGSFAGENFDTGDEGLGALLGVRHIFGNDFEVRAAGRYTSVGTADLATQTIDDDFLFSVGASWMFIRGLSVSVDFETGEIDTWSLGFRLDLDEDD